MAKKPTKAETEAGKAAKPTTAPNPAPTPASAAPADPAAAQSIDGASGAILEEEIAEAVDLAHPAIDSNPRAGTVAAQNARDMNDPANRKPGDEGYVGQGLDASVYGKVKD
ncbi:hypothetical protein ACXN5S_16385 [Pseudoroseicyclus sp. H15]